MRCDCCGRRKGFFESFAVVKNGDLALNLCARCNDLAYKTRDAAAEHDREKFDLATQEWQNASKHVSRDFGIWQDHFITTVWNRFND